MDKYSELIESLNNSPYSFSNEERFIYRTDTTRYEGNPDMVVHAGSIEDIQSCVKFAYENNIPIIARGAGTGMSGGVVAIKGGIIINFERMNKIIEIDRKRKLAFVEPGVITSDLQKEAEKIGLYYPPDPSSNRTSTLGGNIAENAGGLHCVKYGVTSKYVRGLKYIDNKGNLIKSGIYDESGVNNLSGMLVGSEGILGIIVEACLSLVDEPIVSVVYRAYFDRLEKAIECVKEIKNSFINPSVLEIMDRTVIGAVRNYKKLDIPQKTDAVLLIEVDDKSLPELSKKADRLEMLLNGYSFSFTHASGDEEIADIWEVRKAISPSVRSISPNKMNEDIVVPITNFTKIIKAIKEISDKYSIKIPVYGHAGDGNLHVNILYDKKDIVSKEKAELAAEEVFLATIKLGGSITGEHGVGLSKKKFLSIQYTKDEIDLIKKIKRAFDKTDIINPDKIVTLKK